MWDDVSVEVPHDTGPREWQHMPSVLKKDLLSFVAWYWTSISVSQLLLTTLPPYKPTYLDQILIL